MQKGAKTLVDVCTRVQAGETVLVVTDYSKSTIAKAIAAVALDRGAEPMVMAMKPRDRAGQEPPAPIAEAMKAADVVFIPVSYSITHTHAVKNAAANGSRVIVMTDFTEEMMIHGGLRRGNALYCIVEPGEFSTVPTVEANVSPVEGSANGRIVADASIPYLGIGVLSEPVIVEVRDGLIVSIDGGIQARMLKDNLAAQNDPNVYNIAEIGTGLNPKCRMCGLMLEDEGVISTSHIGIGTSITLGGTVKAAVHYDLLMWKPTIKVDGVAVIDGKNVML